MKKQTFRNLSILVVLLLILVYLSPIVLKDKSPEFLGGLKLGLDLQGGMQIQLQVDTAKIPVDDRNEIVESAVQIIRNRIDQFGVAEPSIQRVGQDRILIQLPGLKSFERAKDLIGKTAKLEFKLLASEKEVQDTYSKLNKYLVANLDKYPELKKISEQESGNLLEVNDSTSVESNYSELFNNLTTAMGQPGSVSYENTELFKELLKEKEIRKAIPNGVQIALEKVDPKAPLAPRRIYFLLKKAEVEGKNLTDAAVRNHSQSSLGNAGKPYVSLTFNKVGAKQFATVTGQNINKQLAIVLDGIVYSAPVIQSRIPDGQAQITGSFSIAECRDLVIVLKAGNLPADVKVIEERTVGPSLGKESISAGIKSAIWGLAVVLVFMIIYYKLSGVLAAIAVLVNMGFILAGLTILNATLTLPGIGGIILTIGMAVDANVIIFERIREELKSGKSVRSAVDFGFKRAVVTIFDANITTLFTAAVLYYFGTGPIRGFAVTLSIGIIGSMFAAIVLVQAMFDLFVTSRNRKDLSI